MTNLLVPKKFDIPKGLETYKMRLRMLSVNDIVKDYDAVMTSIEHLQETKPFGPDHKWPTEELTFEQDLIDLGWHQKEFQRRTSFSYTVMSLDESECLGCLYIYPSSNSKHDAEIVMWVRENKIELDQHLFESVTNWVNREWPFKNPGYPGRSIDWQSWNELK
jgi:hypothetical protein